MKDERVYLGHIRDAINDIKSYAAVGETDDGDVEILTIELESNLGALAGGLALVRLLLDEGAECWMKVLNGDA